MSVFARSLSPNLARMHEYAVTHSCIRVPFGDGFAFPQSGQAYVCPLAVPESNTNTRIRW